MRGFDDMFESYRRVNSMLDSTRHIRNMIATPTMEKASRMARVAHSPLDRAMGSLNLGVMHTVSDSMEKLMRHQSGGVALLHEATRKAAALEQITQSPGFGILHKASQTAADLLRNHTGGISIFQAATKHYGAATLATAGMVGLANRLDSGSALFKALGIDTRTEGAFGRTFKNMLDSLPREGLAAAVRIAQSQRDPERPYRRPMFDSEYMPEEASAIAVEHPASPATHGGFKDNLDKWLKHPYFVFFCFLLSISPYLVPVIQHYLEIETDTDQIRHELHEIYNKETEQTKQIKRQHDLSVIGSQVCDSRSVLFRKSGTSSERICIIPKGAEVDVFNMTETMLHVEYFDPKSNQTREGWVLKKNFKPLK